MRKNDNLYLVDMVEHARMIRSRVSGLSRRAFDQDQTLQLALVHLIQIIGEAASRIAPERRSEIPSVPWEQIIGMRHRIVHDYLDTDDEIVWSVVTQSIPELLSVLEPCIGDIIAQRKKTGN